MPTLNKPNILLLCTDQQRFDSLGCYGNTHVQTPNLDRLASQGARFEACYVQNTVCSPSRASLFTGKYARNHGLWANGSALPAHQDMFTRALADAGFDCGLIGKQHLAACEGATTEPRHGNDGFRVFEWSHGPQHRSRQNAYHEWLRQKAPDTYERLFPWSDEANKTTVGAVNAVNQAIDEVEPELHYSHWVAERAIDFIDTSRPDDNPFFLIANFFDPHSPFGAPENYRSMIDSDSLPAPKGHGQSLDDRPAGFRHYSNSSQGGKSRGAADFSPEELQEVQALYLAMVVQIDAEVGRILEALNASGQAENTLVIFTSDHGEMLGDHQTLLKGPMMNEGAVRVPLILRWPGVVPEGTLVSELVQLIDVTASITDAAGVRRFDAQQGQSLFPLIDGSAAGRGWAFCEYRNSGPSSEPPISTTMLRRDDIKIVVWHGAPATEWDRDGELYDLASDPDELTNLFHSPEHADLREYMFDSLIDVFCAIEDHSQPRVARW